jgi:uncharacterized protein (TIGR00369 family)
VRGGYLEPPTILLPGIEQLRALLAGTRTQPPISRLTGMRLAEVEEERVTFELPLTEWLQVSQGTIPLGPLTIPADAAMACSILTVLAPRTPFTTWELSLRLLAPARPGRRIFARGRLLTARTGLALADASLTDDEGTLIAHGSTLCVIQPQLEGPAVGAKQVPSSGAPPDPTPDPWQRPAHGQILEAEVFKRRSGLDILRAQLAGELPLPPIHHLTGITLKDAAPNEATLEMPASPWLCAPQPGRVQGGAVALLAEAALSAAIQTTLPPGTAFAPVDLKVNYLRPLAADGAYASAHGVVAHAGRRLALANSTVLDASGQKVAIATGSAMVLAGRPASLGPVQR